MDDKHISSLEQERIKIISALPTASRSEIAALVDLHSTVVDQQLAAEKHIIASNIEKLPDELVLECFKQAFVQDPHSIYPFLFLNRSWQAILLSTPLIWRSILLENDDPDQLQKLHMSLYMSQDLPVDVTLRFSSDDLTKGLALDVLAVNRHRIRSIQLQSNQISTVQVSQARLTQTLAELGSLPNLKVLSWSPIPGVMLQADPIIMVPPGQLACYPSLEQLVNWMIRDEDVHLIPAPERIIEISLITVAKGWKPYIYPMLPNLRSIEFLLFQGGESSLPPKKDGDYLRNCQIETVVCRTNQDIPGHLLPILLLSSIRTLDLSFSSQSLTQFMAGGINFPPIRSLSLTIVSQQNGDTFDLPSILPDLSTVNDFRLTMQRASRSTENGTHGTVASFHNIMLMFSRILRHCQNFGFYSNPVLPLDPLFHFLDQCVRLISLEIAFLETYLSYDGPAIILSTVELLKVTPPGILCHLDAPYCRSIEIYGNGGPSTYFFKGSSRLSSATLAINHVDVLKELNTSRLQNLFWTPRGWHSLSPSLNGELWNIYSVRRGLMSFFAVTLEVRTLQSVSFAITVDQTQQHDIMLEMIRSPDALPCLRVIAFSRYPSLVLLMGLLVRRNIYSPSRVHGNSISEVKLPSYPSKEVLLPLSKLVQRCLPSPEEFEEEMPEEDLSRFDETITGCDYCFESGHFCQEPMVWCSNPSDRTNGQTSDSLSGLGQPRRPICSINSLGSKASVEQWIVDWKRWWLWREGVLNMFHGGHSRRNYCVRHKPFNLVSITGKLGPSQLLEQRFIA